MATVTLWCWIYGEGPDNTFIVEISSTASVAGLKDAIKSKRSVDLALVDARRLALYSISLPDDQHFEDVLTKLTLNGKQRINSWQRLPSLNLSDVLIIVEVPGRMRKRDYGVADDDVVERAKHAKIANEAPSNLAQPKLFKNWHEDPQKYILDHRRTYDDDRPSGDELLHFVDELPPISLHYDGFGYFIDISRGHKDIRGMENVSFARLRSAVDVFAEKMSLIYGDEQIRRCRGLVALNDILSARTDGLSFQLMPAPVSRESSSDGYILGPHQAACCIVEFENESTGTSIPYVEMTSYFAHSTRQATMDFASVMRGWNFPCLGLTIIGHYVTFYAMIYLGRWRVVALTPGLSCIRASCDGDDRTALYDAFIAASVLLARIEKEATRLVHNPPPPIPSSRLTLPPISSLHHPHSDNSIQFTILEFFPRRASDRHLYIAKTTDEKEIIVKFTRRYSYELHAFCADRGHAPALLGFERLPGGFFGIAMEFVRPAIPILQSPYIEKHTEWAEGLQRLVEDFHTRGLVHGDLRSPNIVCYGNRVMVIDFDWGGKLGEVSYPNTELNIDLTVGRDNTDLKITKDDDIRVLRNTLGNLRRLK